VPALSCCSCRNGPGPRSGDPAYRRPPAPRVLPRGRRYGGKSPAFCQGYVRFGGTLLPDFEAHPMTSVPGPGGPCRDLRGIGLRGRRRNPMHAHRRQTGRLTAWGDLLLDANRSLAESSPGRVARGIKNGDLLTEREGDRIGKLQSAFGRIVVSTSITLLIRSSSGRIGTTGKTCSWWIVK
jgi:hypothetical protein